MVDKAVAIGSRNSFLTFLFLIIPTFWGGSFVAIKYVLIGMSPVAGAALRVAISLVCLLLVFAFLKKETRLKKENRWRVWSAGIFCIGLPWALLFWGEKHISAGLAGIINGTVPIWTFVLGFVFLKNLEPFSWRKVIGLSIGLIGALMIFSPLITFGGTHDEFLGTIAIFFMAISYAIGTLLTRSVLSGKRVVPFYANLFHQHVAGLAFLLLLSIGIEGGSGSLHLTADARSIAASVYMGICSTAFAFIGFYHLVRTWGAVKATSTTYIVPIVALLLDFFLFGHKPRAIELIGMATVLIGVGIIQGRIRRHWFTALDPSHP